MQKDWQRFWGNGRWLLLKVFNNCSAEKKPQPEKFNSAFSNLSLSSNSMPLPPALCPPGFENHLHPPSLPAVASHPIQPGKSEGRASWEKVRGLQMMLEEWQVHWEQGQGGRWATRARQARGWEHRHTPIQLPGCARARIWVLQSALSCLLASTLIQGGRGVLYIYIYIYIFFFFSEESHVRRTNRHWISWGRWCQLHSIPDTASGGDDSGSQCGRFLMLGVT